MLGLQCDPKSTLLQVLPKFRVDRLQLAERDLLIALVALAANSRLAIAHPACLNLALQGLAPPPPNGGVSAIRQGHQGPNLVVVVFATPTNPLEVHGV